MVRTRLLLTLPAAALCAAPAVLAAQPLGPSGEHATVVVADRTPTLNGAPGAAVYWPGGGAPTGQNNARYASNPAAGGNPQDGVARLLINRGATPELCTGSLLWTGMDILTAAHCVWDFTAGRKVAPGIVNVDFTNGDLSGYLVGANVANVGVMAGYNGTSAVSNNDLAVLRLSTPAPAWVPRYSLYSGDPLGLEYTLVGFGRTGNGVTGGILREGFGTFPIRRQARNVFDAYRVAGKAFDAAGSHQYQTPTPILESDFDGSDPGGTYPVRGGAWPATTAVQNDRFCNYWTPLTLADDPEAPELLDLVDVCTNGLGLFEGLIGRGDSGGPAFIASGGALRIAAVASYGNSACYPSQATPPRTDGGCAADRIRIGSRFGDYSGHVVVSQGAGRAYVFAAAPEPSTWVLMGTGLLGLAGAVRRRRAA